MTFSDFSIQMLKSYLTLKKDKELEQLFPPDADVYAPRYVDKPVKVFTKNGQEERALLTILST